MPDDSQNTILNAAVVLQNLPATQRTQLLEKLEPRQAATLADAMNQLGPIDGDRQEAVLRAFAEARAARFGRRHSKNTAPFRFLHDLKTDALASLLADERPQAVALVLSHLPPQQAGAALAKLSPEQQVSVVHRIATIGEPSPDVVGEVEEVLRRRLTSLPRRATGARGLSGVVRILNVMEPPAERRLLGALAESDPALLHEIRRAMFGPDVAECEDWDAMEAAG